MKLFFTFVFCFIAMQFGLSVGQAAETCSIQATSSYGESVVLNATSAAQAPVLDQLADQCFSQLRAKTNEPAEDIAAECANIVVDGC